MRTITRSGCLLLSAALALASCATRQSQQATPECGKCDEGTERADVQPLMQKSPPGESAITRNKAGEWFFATLGARGEIVLQSQPYVARASAANGILSVEENGVDLDRYRVSVDEQGNWLFVLRAANNQTIATSPVFSTEAEATAGITEARDLIASILQFKADVEHGARFDLRRSKADEQWYFTLLDADGTVLIRSEGYTGRTGAINGIQSVRRYGKDEGRYVLDGASFILKAGNGQEIGRSETYSDQEAALAGLKHVQSLLQRERVANPW